ncbi:NAD(+) diphosphatase [Angustibacter sp. McL0619]|uniref:NAD(+) diphosphatase n=1 Tax=Angustibacter sp. McL0619 TaxID=3415676 RepID=UPI003CF1AA5E
MRHPAAAALPDLPLATPITDRAGHRRGPLLIAELVADPATRVLEVATGRARTKGGSALTLRAPEPADAERLALFLGEDREATSYLAVEVEAADDDPQWQGLRALAVALPAEQAGMLVQAVGVFNWHAVHQHCPRCGTQTEVVAAGYTRRCPADGSEHWPRTDPAVIMTVVDDDDRLLLGRHAGWPSGRFSTLAGFVEPGESLESTVRREVLEEVGVRIGEVSYLGSQPWPFPSSIMLGFDSRALTTDLHPDGAEIAEARWFERAELLDLVQRKVVGLSPRLSISRALVEHWYGERLPDPPP